jgi:hypothetical protein
MSAADEYTRPKDSRYEARRRRCVVNALRAGVNRTTVARAFRMCSDTVNRIVAEEGLQSIVARTRGKRT